jgi:NADH-quinone oxidoreductase subunit E
MALSDTIALVVMTDEEEELKQQTAEILASCNKERKALIPILQGIQAKFGYLPKVAMLKVAEFLSIPESTVYGVATFYNQFRFNPPGKHPIKVCLGTACHVKGGKIILESWERELGIKVGETTPDREFSLERVACVGCCAMAPVTVLKEKVEGKVTPTRVKGIILSYNLEKEREDSSSQ